MGKKSNLWISGKYYLCAKSAERGKTMDKNAENWEIARQLTKVVIRVLQSDIKAGKVTDPRLVLMFGEPGKG